MIRQASDDTKIPQVDERLMFGVESMEVPRPIEPPLFLHFSNKVFGMRSTRSATKQFLRQEGGTQYGSNREKDRPVAKRG